MTIPTTGGYVFTGVCLFNSGVGGGGVPTLAGGYLPWQRGVLTLARGDTHHGPGGEGGTYLGWDATW